MLDLRLPIGMMFSLVGGLLVVYGLVTYGNDDLYKCSQGIRINFWWGLALAIFGLLMWYFSIRAARAEKGEGPG